MRWRGMPQRSRPQDFVQLGVLWMVSRRAVP